MKTKATKTKPSFKGKVSAGSPGLTAPSYKGKAKIKTESMQGFVPSADMRK